MQTKLATFVLAVVTSGCAVMALAAEPENWPYWRGPAYDGTSTETNLVETWDPDGGEGSNLIWKSEALGGRCTPTILDGKLYMNLRAERGTPREGEKTICVDAETGEILWENRFNVWLSDVPDTRVGWSSVVADPETGNVYSLGVCDFFQCLDGETGETLWSKPLHEKFGMLSTYGGRTNFPIICDDVVIISGIIINHGERAKPNHRFIGMDKRTGEVLWFNGTRDLPYDTTYSGPSIATINGQKQLVVGAGDGAVWGIQPRTGRPLWHYDLSRRGLFATPLVVGNRVFATHSEENLSGGTMGAIVALEVTGSGDDTDVKELWKIERLVIGRSAPMFIDGRIYVIDDRNKLQVIDAESGEFIGDPIKIGDSRQFSSPLYADGKLYILTENGRWAVMEPTAEGAEMIDRGRLRRESFLAAPVAYDGRLYFPGTGALYCVGDPSTPSSRTARPAPPAETPVSENPEPSWLQLTPAEALLRPGENLPLEVNLFNELGQHLRAVDLGEVSFSVDGVGRVEDGVYQAPAEAAHRAVEITATVEDLSGTVRLRIVPDLPWNFDFEQADDAPVTWVGARYRHVIRTVDGSPALVKVTTIPKGARSRAWMGHSDLSDYTIAADVKGERRLDQLPDIGLVAQGYVLDLQGNSQKLQIRSWSTQLRMASTVDFPWEADVWYRMKLRAEIDRSGETPVAILRGKVWPKDQPEPEAWSIEARDESPNLHGSPGLYGNAKVAELYIDNLSVVPNGS